jgi:hypothetical protein
MDLLIPKDWLIEYSRSRIFHLYGEITITGEGVQNLGLCSALRAFEQGGVFIVPHLHWDTGPRFFWFHPKDRTIQSPHTTRMGMRRTYSISDPHAVINHLRFYVPLKNISIIWRRNNCRWGKIIVNFNRFYYKALIKQDGELIHDVTMLSN